MRCTFIPHSRLLWLVLSLTACLTSGCWNSESGSDSEDSKRVEQSAEEPAGNTPAVDSSNETRDGSGSHDEMSGSPEEPVEDVITQEFEPDGLNDGFVVNSFSFTFHKESQHEICDFWENFIYNGSVRISGALYSTHRVDFTTEDFELTLVTPFDIYSIPAVRERESHDDFYDEPTFKRTADQRFELDDYRMEDDVLVYADDEDEVGEYLYYGPLMDATIDFTSRSFEIRVERAELLAADIEPGDEMTFMLSFPRADRSIDDFDEVFTWTYDGRSIAADDYYWNGDCP